MKIKKVYLKNFKSFEEEEFFVNPGLNIFIGDNGAGKSSILQAIELVLKGSVTKLNLLGIENLFNVQAIEAWKSNPSLKLPVLEVDLFFEMPEEPQYSKFSGEKYAKSQGEEFGVKLVCEANPDFSKEIEDHIESTGRKVFPFDFYYARFSTFSDLVYNGYVAPIRSCYVDNTSINTERALRFVVGQTYRNAVASSELPKIRQKFRAHVENFNIPEEVTSRGIYVSGELDQFLEMRKDGVRLENLGLGEISTYKIKSAIEKSVDSPVFLVEEPENHLSHFRLRELVQVIEAFSQGGQVFITTHSSYITSRLGLNSVFFVGKKVQSLKDLDEETSKFFMKLPCDNLLQFVLSQKVILVEGAAEYILMDSFIKKVTGKNSAENGIWVMSLNGLSFKRYMRLGAILDMKVAVIRDNDGKAECYYKDFQNEKIKVFTDNDTSRNTFEICLYQDNQALFNSEFGVNALECMLGNKAEAAFKILSLDADVNVSEYIQDAIKWICG